MKILLLISWMILSTGSTYAFINNKPTIYGTDDRIEIYQAPREWQIKADSTVALIANKNLSAPDANGEVKLGGSNYGSSYNLCSTERFREQSSVAYCSGSLITQNIVMTAGHCIANAIDCKNTKLVFGFGYAQENQSLASLPATEMYACKQVIARQQDNQGADFSIVYLDRPVLNHAPLALSPGVATVGDPVVIIGHPAGIPTKIASNANVRSVADGYFVANLDDYGGNSGSPVFNLNSGLIVGILVRGDTDFVTTGNACQISYVNPLDGGRGEDVTRIDAVIPQIPH